MTAANTFSFSSLNWLSELSVLNRLVSSAPQWQQLPPPPTTSPSTPFVSNQSSFLRSFQNRSPSSGVLLTVSPSLKTPGFLAERGTYSFRICPPSGHSTKGQNLPGVTLPGGFTLIDLPKPGGHTPPALTGNAANTATNGARPQRDDLFRSDRLPANSGAAELDLATDHGDTRVLDRLSVSSAELTCDESDDAQRRPTGLEESNASESSDSSDYREEDEDVSGRILIHRIHICTDVNFHCHVCVCEIFLSFHRYGS